MLMVTIGLALWIGGGTLAALAIGRASAIGSEPMRRGIAQQDRS